MSAIVLPGPLQRRVESAAAAFLAAPGLPHVDFSRPAGEPALVPADSLSWRIFRNPVALFIGGVAAVILELAEPRVRSGVWDHTSFRSDPVGRLRRTGLAAMVTVYGARSTAEAMIAGVGRRHAAVTGTADDGRTYAADDVELLDWVHATAGYGFGEAFHRFVRPLSEAERDRAWAEGAEAARLYGALGAPTSQAQWAAQLAAMTSKLTRSPVVFEFLQIMREAPALPAAARPLQRMLVRAAVDLTPPAVADVLDLDRRHGLRPGEAAIVGALARAADRLMLRSSPAAQASVRLGLPADHLWR
ncbi:MAG TPA: oxygenase MpaB family protein [Brevundimonas sp.]|uniref:oxygenase MpaB family protein n=1 Tax=Brevundimonas sp. TaxID=1871086 RepID=UPI002DF361C0|nr:oxygenase MpaB family protein [Brevundimonas sp.]